MTPVRANPAAGGVVARGALVLAGLAAYLVPALPLTVPSLFLIAIGLVALTTAVVRPGSWAPLAVIVIAVMGYVVNLTSGTTAHWLVTGVLAAAVVVVHVLAAQLAQVPAGAEIEWALAGQIGRKVGFALVVTGVVLAVAALARLVVDRLPGSEVLELAGIAGAVVAAAVPLLMLVTRRARRGDPS